MPLLHLPGHHSDAHAAHIQPNRLLEYTAVGAAAGAATHALGTAILRPLDRDHMDVGGAALAGLAGGAAIHAGYGLLAAVAKTQRTRTELRTLAASTTLSAALGGLLGAAMLSRSDVPVPRPGHLVVAGIVGGLAIGAAAGAYRMAHTVCCLCWPACLSVDEPSEHGSIFGDEDEHRHILPRRSSSFESARGV